MNRRHFIISSVLAGIGLLIPKGVSALVPVHKGITKEQFMKAITFSSALYAYVGPEKTHFRRWCVIHLVPADCNVQTGHKLSEYVKPIYGCIELPIDISKMDMDGLAYTFKKMKSDMWDCAVKEFKGHPFKLL